MTQCSVKAVVSSADDRSDEFSRGSRKGVVFRDRGREIQVHARAQRRYMIAVQFDDASYRTGSVDGGIVVLRENTASIVFGNGFYPGHEGSKAADPEI